MQVDIPHMDAMGTFAKLTCNLQMKWSEEYQMIGRLWIGKMLETKCNKCLKKSELEKIHCGKEPELQNYLEIVFILYIQNIISLVVKVFFKSEGTTIVTKCYSLQTTCFQEIKHQKTTNQNSKSGSHSFNQTSAASNIFVSAEGSNIHMNQKQITCWDHVVGDPYLQIESRIYLDCLIYMKHLPKTPI